MPGFSGPRVVRRNGGARRGGFVGPVRRVVAPAPRVVATSRSVTVKPKADFRSHYDPSRVIDLDKLKVVQDLRAPQEFAAERGERTTEDNGTTGPGSTSGAFATGQRVGVKTEPSAIDKNAGLILAAIAAAFVLGG